MKTPGRRFWIELIALTIGIACIIALCIATLSMAAGSTADPQAADPMQPEQTAVTQAPSAKLRDVPLQTYEGMISDSRCGAKHEPSIAKNASDCARICVRGGAQFTLINGERTYILDGDKMLLKRVAGRRATI